jgi:very-short-patch-repair endonuclease
MVNPPLPSRLHDHTREMRSAQTDAEQKLWSHLRATRLGGYKFRRQHLLPPFVVDSCCIEQRLIVELDGSQHGDDADVARTKVRSDAGFRVLRFWNNDVLTQTDAVLEAILGVIAKTEPSPQPLSRRERG